MTRLPLPTLTVDVLEAPLTAEEYRTQTDLTADGSLTRHVSLDVQSFVSADWDTNIDTIAAAVVAAADLGLEWQLESYRLVGADPRQDGTPDAGCFGIFAVTVNPDIDR